MLIPEEIPLGYDYMEFYGLRVVSTGKISRGELSSGIFTSTKLAETVELEVYVDDGNSLLANNNPFNIALLVFPAPDFNEDISPRFLANYVQRVEALKLFE